LSLRPDRTDRTGHEDVQMPPLIVWAVGALGGAAVVRWALREARRINSELEQAHLARAAEAARSEGVRTLRLDPQTGVYRPE
jgi:hypothetical protein